MGRVGTTERLELIQRLIEPYNQQDHVLSARSFARLFATSSIHSPFHPKPVSAAIIVGLPAATTCPVRSPAIPMTDNVDLVTATAIRQPVAALDIGRTASPIDWSRGYLLRRCHRDH